MYACVCVYNDLGSRRVLPCSQVDAGEGQRRRLAHMQFALWIGAHHREKKKPPCEYSTLEWRVRRFQSTNVQCQDTCAFEGRREGGREGEGETSSQGCVSIWAAVARLDVSIYIYMYVCTYYIYTYINIYVCMYVCMYVCVCVCIPPAKDV